MRIYLRHAEKEYDNGQAEAYKHDPGLTKAGQKQAIQTSLALAKQYGMPSCILCSPFKRARQTALVMKMALEKVGQRKIKVFCDAMLSEYLGNRRDEQLDVTAETAKYNPPHPEKFYQLKQRVQEHEEYASSAYAGTNIWLITHGIVIKELAKYLEPELKLPRRLPNLSGITINNGYIDTYGIDRR